MGRLAPHSRSEAGALSGCTLIGWSGGTPIWHTDNTAPDDLPEGLPPTVGGTPPLYRGFPVDRLELVLATGLDRPSPHDAFFASAYESKAWEYPPRRSTPAMMVIDRDRCARSFVRASDDSGADLADYPHAYVDDTLGETIHSRFPGTPNAGFRYESDYGYWMPAAPRAALLAVVLGGSWTAIEAALTGLSLPAPYCIVWASADEQLFEHPWWPDDDL